MPNVGEKKFPYTPEGIRRALKLGEKTGEPVVYEDRHYGDRIPRSAYKPKELKDFLKFDAGPVEISLDPKIGGVLKGGPPEGGISATYRFKRGGKVRK
jgi:hypothetical protein